MTAPERPGPIPDSHRRVTPCLAVHGAAQALEFYAAVFGATERMLLPGPGGETIRHAEVQIGDSVVMIEDEDPRRGTKAAPSGVIRVDLHHEGRGHRRREPFRLSGGQDEREPVQDLPPGAQHQGRHGSAKTTLDTYGHLWPDKDESTKAVIDALVDSKFGDLADSVRTEGGRAVRRPQFSGPGRATRRSTARTRAGAGAA
jgi:uncharacterized glyoxalase superfamily protein PhnB